MSCMLQLGSFSVFPRKKRELLLCSAVVEHELNSASPPVLFWAAAHWQAQSSARYTSKALMSWGMVSVMGWNHTPCGFNQYQKKTTCKEFGEVFREGVELVQWMAFSLAHTNRAKSMVGMLFANVTNFYCRNWQRLEYNNIMLELQFVSPSWLHFQPRAHWWLCSQNWGAFL